MCASSVTPSLSVVIGATRGGGRCSKLTHMRAPGLLPEQVCTDPRFGRTEENFGEVRKSSSRLMSFRD